MRTTSTDLKSRMRQWVYSGLCLFLLSLFCLSASAQAPTNDNFANAQIITGSSGTITGGNGGATKETGEPNHAGYSGGHSIWYSWTAPNSMFAVIDTKGSNFSTVSAVYTGASVGNLTPVTSTYYDTPCYFTPTAGTTYYIAVDSASSSRTGTVILNWKQVAPPPNDNFANAQIISGNTSSVKGTNLAATKEAGEPDHYYSTRSSVWYRWTAPGTGAYAYTTKGSSFSTVLAVYTGGAVNSLTKVASNYYDSKYSQSRVLFEATAGTTYSIAVDSSYNPSYGDIALSWSSVARPPNDNFANAQLLSGNAGTVGGTIEAATKETGEPNHAGSTAGHSVWYRWTAPGTGAYAFNTLGSDFSTVLAVYTGTSVSNLTLISNNTNDGSRSTSRVVLDATSGTTYFIAVDGSYATSGNILLSWQNGVRPPNDHLANAQILSGGSGHTISNNVFATAESGEPSHGNYYSSGRSVWYQWTAPTSGMVALNTVGSDFDTVLAVYTGAQVNSLTGIAANDDDGPLKTSWVAFNAVAGTTYSIAVDGYNNAAGDIALTWLQGGSDIDRDGQSDLVWQNSVTGDVSVWYMNGAAWSGLWEYVAKSVPTQWKIVGMADFNSDGKTDVVWQNSVTGDVTVWYMEGSQWTGNFDYLGRAVPTQWKVVGLADLDGDGKTDLIWQNTQTGDVTYWLLDGARQKGTGFIAKAVSLDMKIVGTADLNRDGKADLIWQNSATGDVSVWYMNGVTSTGNSDYIARSVSSAWKIAAILDTNFDSHADLIWQNTQTGDVTVWYMNSATWTGNWDYIARGVPTDWKIVRTH